MKRIVFIGFLLLIMLGTQAIGQVRTITGVVTDATDQSTLPGVSIMVKGTTQGTVTDINGRYELQAAGDAVLTFSFIGMETMEVPVDDRSVINVSMATSMVGLDEVIVVAYGSVRRSSFTGAASSVRAEKIERVPVTSVEKALQGGMPGLQVTAASGQPGSNTQVLLRGIGSISAGTAPLYVVDGVPIAIGDYSQQSSTTNALSHINPSDIESITVLKDASATAIYGSRASNGVILISTKQGKEGKTVFSMRSQLGLSSRTNKNFDVLNAQEYIMLTNEGRVNSGLAPQDFTDAADFDWLAAAFRDDAPTQNYELSARGGTERTKFFVSGSYFDQQGMAYGSSMTRASARINLDHEANDRLSFGLNVGLSNTNQDTPLTDAAYFTSPVTGSFLMPPIYSAYNPDGTYNMSYPAMGGTNFVANLDYNDLDSYANRIIGSSYAQYNFTDELSLKSNFGLDYLDLLEEFYDDPRAVGNTAFERGRASASMTKNLIYSTSTVLSYNNTFAELHNLSALVGHEAQGSDLKDFYVSSEDFASYQLRKLASGATPYIAFGSATGWRLSSMFSSLNYNMDNKYYLSGSFRRDGSSRFGRNHRYASFWSVGTSWRMSSESFIKDNVDFIDNLQLRASYGTAGNSSIGNFASMGLYGYGFDYDGKPGSGPSQFENPDLTWEKNINWNIGLDYRLFDRVTGTVEYYNRITSDLLLNVPLSSTAGITTQLRNIGEMQNKGWEFQVAVDVVNPRNAFTWNVDANVAFNQNKIVKLVDGEDIPAGTQIRREGESFRSWYLRRWAGVNPANGMPLWYDEEGELTSNYSQAAREIVGTADPDFFGGFTNTFAYKGFSVSAFFSFTYGNLLFDDTYRLLNSDGAFVGFNQSTDQLNRWTTPGQITDTPIRLNGNATSSNQASTRNLYDGSYLRLRNLTASYSLPSSLVQRARFTNARIFVQGQNLFTWTEYPGMDPEQQLAGTVWFVYPNAKTITFGLELSF
ncbi:MAG: TonB-dependent receptor [Bacteroidales bacterium]